MQSQIICGTVSEREAFAIKLYKFINFASGAEYFLGSSSSWSFGECIQSLQQALCLNLSCFMTLYPDFMRQIYFIF